ncbi:MAG: hypothetical protein WCK59_01040 [Candidatus Falkowbacteria bacterium]
MMENRKKIGILIIIAAILILAIIIIIFLQKTKSPVTSMTATTTTLGGNLGTSDNLPLAPTSTPGDVPRNYQSYDISKEAPHKLNANDAAKLSSLFAERLGSFSNQSDYGNVTDLKIFMTATMKSWADKYVADLRAQKYSGSYYGITTRALTTKVLSYDDKTGKARIEVSAERRESQADILGVAYIQKMTLDLVKVNNEWLVDGAFWEKK